MGNLLATLGTIGVPLFNHLVTIPFIYHPHRWGGVPWQAPGWFQLAIVTFIANIALVFMLGTLGSIMSTKQSCNKTDIPLSFVNSMWKVAGFMAGSAILSVFVSLKGPFLVWLGWMPYSSWVVHGLLISIPVLLLGSLGTSALIRRVCPPPAPTVRFGSAKPSRKNSGFQAKSAWGAKRK